MKKSGLAHGALGLHTASYANPYLGNKLFGGFCRVVADDIGNCVREIETLAEREVTKIFDLAYARNALFK
jgi:hypothetical protein